MSGLLLAGIGLATQSLKFLTLETQNKYAKELADLEKAILAEEERGYDSDDAKIEHLQKEVKIALEAISNEIKLHLSA